MASLFAFFGTTQEEYPAEIQLFPWLVWALASCIVVHCFTARERSLSSVILLGMGLFAVGAGILLPFYSSLKGLLSWSFGVLFLACSAMRVTWVNTVPIQENRHVRYVEAAVLCTSAFLLLQAGEIVLPPIYNTCMLFSVFVTFLVNICARVADRDGTSRSLSRLQGAVVLGVLSVVILVLLGLFATFGSFPLQQGLIQMLNLLWTAIGIVTGVLGRFFSWLISLLPDQEPAEMTLEMQQGFELPEAQESPLAALPPWSIPVALLVAGLLGCIAAIVLLRKTKLSGRRLRRRTHLSVHRIRPAFLTAIRRLLQAAGACIRFEWRAMRLRNTPQGMLVWLERWGMHRKLRRKPGETHRAYLQRLEENVPAISTSETRELFAMLSKSLDCFYYAVGTEKLPFGHPEAVRIREICRGKAQGSATVEA